MTVGELINTLLSFELDTEIDVDMLTDTRKPTPLRKVIRDARTGHIILRDYYTVIDTSAEFVSPDGSEYVRVWDTDLYS